MNAKKVKQLRKVARSLAKTTSKEYIRRPDGNLELNKLSEKGLLKELKKSFK